MDIAVVWNPAAFRGDWAVTPGDLVIDQGGLQSAVLLSLFTWRRASPGYLPPAGSSPDLHGWWGDTYEPEQLGSRLWQLDRSKKTDSATLLLQAQDYCQEALAWLITSGVVAATTSVAMWIQPNVMGLSVTLTKPKSSLATFNYSLAWTGA